MSAKVWPPDLLKELLNKYTVHRVYAIGSVEMMQAAAQMTKEKNIPLRVTLNPHMVNGLGLCGSCRVKIDGQYRLACVDGPEFDGHLGGLSGFITTHECIGVTVMGKSNPSYQPKETRIRSLREVSLGFSKKIAQDEARRCPQCAVATCLPGCPLGIDIPGFIRLLREGDTALALERIKKENPFPAICGRICPAPCERGVCFSCGWGSDCHPRAGAFCRGCGPFKVRKAGRPFLEGKKVAIIGSGPSGMSAAYYLAKMNFSVTVFEAAHEPGGLLRYAIPEFRLPQKVLMSSFPD